MSFNILTTSGFKKDSRRLAKKYGSLKNEVAELIASLEKNPEQGSPLGRSCFKIRMAIKSKGKGKSGGARVITCVKVVKNNVYLLTSLLSIIKVKRILSLIKN